VTEGTYISIIDFAKQLGMTPEYIRRLVAKGKIEKSSTIQKGARKFIDPVAARADLDRNLSHINKRRPGTNAPAAPAKKTRKRRSDAEKLEELSEVDAVAAAGFEGISLQAAQTIHERYKAALKKLEYEKKEGELLPADEVRKVWSDCIISARSKILSIKGEIGPLLKEFIEDPANFNAVMVAVEQITFDALKDLQRGSI